MDQLYLAGLMLYSIPNECGTDVSHASFMKSHSARTIRDGTENTPEERRNLFRERRQEQDGWDILVTCPTVSRIISGRVLIQTAMMF